jgi:hypothetical protein
VGALVTLGFGVQFAAPGADTLPRGHAEHTVLRPAAKVFSAQLVHRTAPAAEYLPSVHGAHEAPNLPAAHEEHEVAPASEVLLAVHATHALAAAFEYFPAAHATQTFL